MYYVYIYKHNTQSLAKYTNQKNARNILYCDYTAGQLVHQASAAVNQYLMTIIRNVCILIIYNIRYLFTLAVSK